MRNRYICPVSDITDDKRTIERACTQISYEFESEVDEIQSAISSIESIDQELRDELDRLDTSLGHVKANIFELYEIIKQLKQTISDYEESTL
jgi:predicted  nucleic acid-binding Zn-ribbon protein